MVGLVLFGFSMALLLRADLGLEPWGVLQYGLIQHVPMSYGAMSIVVSFVVLLLWIPLRQWPGLGTVLNAVVIGVAIDATLAVVPPIEGLGWRFAVMVARDPRQRGGRRDVHRQPARARAARRADDRPGSTHGSLDPPRAHLVRGHRRGARLRARRHRGRRHRALRAAHRARRAALPPDAHRAGRAPRERPGVTRRRRARRAARPAAPAWRSGRARPP